MTTDQQPADSPRRAIVRMISAYWVSQGVHVAAKLRLADRVKDGAKSAADLAQATGTHAPSLYRLLRMLASQGIFAEDSQGRFALTPLAECLCDAPLSQYAVALMMGDEHYRAWGDLLYCVRTGKPAFDAIYGKPIFEYLAEHPEQAKIFDQAMTGFHGPETQAMVDAYDFSGINTLIDIGGGNGSLITTVLRKYPAMKGIVYDLPNVVARTAEHLKAAGLADRCRTIPGSFFESAPPGGDGYLMRHIIHDWTDDQCRTILGHCRKVMAPHAKLLVIEMVIPPGNTPAFGKLLDMNMLVLPGGQERTEAEYRALYQSAGFRLSRIVPTTMDVSIVEGVPA
jgi:hypothetical protein